MKKVNTFMFFVSPIMCEKWKIQNMDNILK